MVACRVRVAGRPQFHCELTIRGEDHMQPFVKTSAMTAKEIVSRLSLREKIALMTPKASLLETAWQALILRHYNKRPVRAGGNRRLGIPEIRFCDGPRGLVCSHATCFPVSIARAASFDPDLEEQIGEAIGKEVRAVGGNYFGGVCVNIPRHPAWGRSQESYGEDPFLAGSFGSALVRGITRHNVVACVKHFALNSMENSRFKVDVTCSERTLREVYLPHFKKCIDAGAGSVMAAYNKFRGEHCCENKNLLTEILIDEWRFGGFTLSDFLWGIRDTLKAVAAGMDVEMPLARLYGKKLLTAVKAGSVDPLDIDRSAVRIVRTLLAAKRAQDPEASYPRRLIGCDEHVALAARAADRSLTLIKNERDTLPFDRSAVRRIAVFGKLAKAENLGDYGSSRVHPRHTVSPLEGLKNVGGENLEIIYDRGDNVKRCRGIAVRCDAAVFVVGYDHRDEGEYITYVTGKSGGDRKRLSLHQSEIDLIRAVGPANSRSVAVLVGGGTILVDEWQDDVSAVLMAFYAGMEGGNAIARALFGATNPGGKLPFVIPVREADLPAFDRDADAVEYGYYHGYTKLDKEGIKPSYHFGHGLSYTSFEVSNVSFSASMEGVSAACKVTNTGGSAGDEVVQLYIGFENSRVDRPVKLLRDFRRITLDPSQTREVRLFCSRYDLAWYNPETSSWEIEDMEYQIYVGTSADPGKLISGLFRFP